MTGNGPGPAGVVRVMRNENGRSGPVVIRYEMNRAPAHRATVETCSVWHVVEIGVGGRPPN